MFFSKRHRQQSFDIWPGFVDAIATLLLVIIFVLMTFILAQFYLTDALSDRDDALFELNKEVATLKTTLQQTQTTRTALQQELETLNAKLKELFAENTQTQESLTHKTNESTILSDRLAELNKQLSTLELQNTELKAENQKAKGAFGNYRSEFFAKLKDIVGDRADIRIVGDRFIFQSEVLFKTASADLGVEGKKQLDQLVMALKEITTKIPESINWILRVDGHTDTQPIRSKYPSNWELSSARAISVVKYLITQGIEAKHLVAAGFGENQPLEDSKDPTTQGRNRRIEFKLDQR